MREREPVSETVSEGICREVLWEKGSGEGREGFWREGEGVGEGREGEGGMRKYRRWLMKCELLTSSKTASGASIITDKLSKSKREGKRSG